MGEGPVMSLYETPYETCDLCVHLCPGKFSIFGMTEDRGNTQVYRQ